MDVDAILAAKRSKYKSTDVHKEVDLQYDLGNLLASDLNALDTGRLRAEKEVYLKELARDNTQLLVNKIWQLPVDKTGEVILAELPAATSVLPREKPIPKPKPPTKWELFAKSKGIHKKKRGRMVFDEKAQEWKPRWGYKRVDDPKNDWVLEVPDNADPYEDQFAKRATARQERIAKNDYQRLKNIAKAQKGKGSSSKKLKVPLPPAFTKDLGKHQLTQSIGMSKTATASVGKFTESLPKEPVPKREKKRKFSPVVGQSGAERQKNLKILEGLSKNRKVLDVKKAVNTHLSQEQASVSRKRKAEDQEGGRKRGGGGRGGGGGGGAKRQKMAGKGYKGKGGGQGSRRGTPGKQKRYL